MAIQRWDPMRGLLELQERMNGLFEDVLSRSADDVEGDAAQATAWRPPVDLFEETERYVLRADLPGISATDLEIQIENGRLVLRGERKMDGNISKDSYLRVERPYGRFVVQIALPPSVDQQSIRALHRNGVVEVLLPKKFFNDTATTEIYTH
jgi:HSP20 family protein